VEVTRGAEVESRHRGEIAVVDRDGRPRAAVGDPDTLVCLRSLAKPFQALPLITTGAAQAFGFGPEELALMSGSLSGQDFQVALVEKILARLDLSPGVLQCGSHAPCTAPPPRPWPRPGKSPRPCTTPAPASTPACWPCASITSGRWRTTSIRPTRCSSLSSKPWPTCWASAPPTSPWPSTAAAPRFFMRRCATSPGASPAWPRPPRKAPKGLIMAACLQHPRHIAGDGRLETTIMLTLPGRVFAKTGAEGGFALALAQEGLGVALKIEDGASRALGPAIIEVLHRLDLLTPEARETLGPLWRPVILNHRKQEVGSSGRLSGPGNTFGFSVFGFREKKIEK
jgi:hypothetical protein